MPTFEEIRTLIDTNIRNATGASSITKVKHADVEKAIVDKLEEMASAVSGGSSFVNAADYGVIPNSDPTETVTNLNDLLVGGNKTVVFSVPGEYLLNDTIWLDDNTELVFGEGVYLKKAGIYWNMICNRGALTREWNNNITIRSPRILVNNYESYPTIDDNLFGLRGSINFFYIKKLRIYEAECLDIGTVNWPIHLCTYEDVVIDKPRLSGMKDGIHLGKGSNIIISDYVSSCYDDSVGANGYDYPESNPELGSIENLTINNLTYNHNPAWGAYGGRVINLLGGAVGAWSSGMTVKKGNAFNISGKTYVVAQTDGETPQVSTTQPTVSNFTSVQYVDGIYWRLRENAVTGICNCTNIKINNLVHNSEQFGLIVKYFSGDDGTFMQSIHPSIPLAQYPVFEVAFNGVQTKRGYIGVDAQLSHRTILSGLRGKQEHDILIQSADTDNKSYWLITGNDLTGISGGMTFGNNADVMFSNNIQNYAYNIGGGLSGCRLRSTDKIDIVTPIGFGLVPQNGDHITCSGGEQYMFWGGEWVWVGIWATTTRFGTVKMATAVEAALPVSAGGLTSPNAAPSYTQSEIQLMRNDLDKIFTEYNKLVSHYLELKVKMTIAGLIQG